LAAIIANNIPGSPFEGSHGGTEFPIIPAYMISQSDGLQIKLSDETQVRLPSEKIKLPNNELISSSARGPDMSYNKIKPEIGAPGQSISADAGTGDKESAFGGTSGAAPMISGCAALLLQACPRCKPLKIKSLLMNYADRNMTSDTTGAPAEISRVGAGRVRVDRSLSATFWAYSPDDDQPSLSLGLIDASEDVKITRKVRITSMHDNDQELEVTPTFRIHRNSHPVSIDVKYKGKYVKSIVLEKHSIVNIDITFTIDGAKLPQNSMNSGPDGVDPAKLSANEFDGYFVITSKVSEVALPWHMIGRKAAKVEVNDNKLVFKKRKKAKLPEATIEIVNKGSGAAQIDPFDIVALSNQKRSGKAGQEKPTPDIRAVGYRSSITEYCDSRFLLQFAVNTWERQRHLFGVSYSFDLDTDNDGFYETKMYTESADGADGARLATWVSHPKVGNSTKFFVNHATNSANTVMTICGEQINLSYNDLLQNRIIINAKASSLDVMHEGPGDKVKNFALTPFGERYTPTPGSGLVGLRKTSLITLQPGDKYELSIFDVGVPSFLKDYTSYGVMLLTDGYREEGNSGAATEETETLLLLTRKAKRPKSWNNYVL